jgi:hypothetical protein
VGTKLSIADCVCVTKTKQADTNEDIHATLL